MSLSAALPHEESAARDGLLESLFLQQLPAITRILGGLSRRHSMAAHDAEDFASWAMLRLMDNGYAILRKYRGQSSVGTYLTVVLATMFREYRVEQWGRWRSSTAARRAGLLAVQLELLLERDGLSIAHAGELLRTAGLTTLSNGALARMAAGFPRRSRLRPVCASDAMLTIAAEGSADEMIEEEARDEDLRVVRSALRTALDALETEDRLIVRMHFEESMSVADIARRLEVPQKPLYRKLDRALATMRGRMEEVGVSRDHVASVMTLRC